MVQHFLLYWEKNQKLFYLVYYYLAREWWGQHVIVIGPLTRHPDQLSPHQSADCLADARGQGGVQQGGQGATLTPGTSFLVNTKEGPTFQMMIEIQLLDQTLWEQSPPPRVLCTSECSPPRWPPWSRSHWSPRPWWCHPAWRSPAPGQMCPHPHTGRALTRGRRGSHHTGSRRCTAIVRDNTIIRTISWPQETLGLVTTDMRVIIRTPSLALVIALMFSLLQSPVLTINKLFLFCTSKERF